MGVGCIGYAVVKVVGDRKCGNLAGGCCSLSEVTGECCGGVAAHDPAAGPVAALVGGGCQ
jgi:hypothetical protein